MKIFLLTVALDGIAVMLLGVKIFFTKKGKFPHTHIHGNKEMQERGINCVQEDEFYK